MEFLTQSTVGQTISLIGLELAFFEDEKRDRTGEEGGGPRVENEGMISFPR